MKTTCLTLPLPRDLTNGSGSSDQPFGASGEVFLVSLGPTRGGEIRKMRPCVIVSPDELNVYLRTFIVAPLTTGGHPYPFRVPCRFGRRAGHVVLDQIRTVDRERLVRRVGRLSPPVVSQVLQVLQEMFAE